MANDRQEPSSPSAPPLAEAPPAILELVDRFERNIEAYKAPGYNETQVRREFLDPFFEALGWDVNNTAGYAEAYKDVIHEDAIKIAGSARAPDYCFRIGGQRKFFVEAKKPNVYIKEDIQPAYQLRRYAWSAKLALSIVTDFEEFAVYDCRIRPDRADKASVARINYMTFRDYPSRWQEIVKIFSPEAIRKGSFDRYAEGNKAKRGTTEVDDAFLGEIESWREALAKNIALRNRALSQHDVNFAVQRTIDRIVFLRICEDRGVEDYGRLQTLQKGEGIYARLCERFQRADEKYNSGLFHFRQERDRSETPDSLTPALAIDDAPLRQVLGALYYPESPYVFAEIPADILGQVYERFLGKIIRLTAGHQAKIEEKPEVRKAGGVYYTPTYIVEHIVRATLGPLVDGRKPAEVAKLRILDPACGSGSFLLGAYQFLLDWHREAYLAGDPEKWARGKTPALFRGPRGDWQLTTAKRKEILLNNIFGVDLDAQAIEVTKLSLLLNVLEGETEERVNRNLRLFHDRALPDLGKNIKCGNSLVGPDFYADRPVSLLGAEDDAINAFDWRAAFPSVFASGGFDAVIGNPPYLSYGGRQVVELAEGVSEYFAKHYACAGWPTAHSLFMERSAKLLSRRFVSFIVPDQVGHLEGYRSIREVLGAAGGLAEVKYWGEHVFRGVTTPALTFVLDKGFRGSTNVVEKDGTVQPLTLGSGDVWGQSASRSLLAKLAARSFSVKPFVADCGIRTTAAKEQVVDLAAAKGTFLPALEGKQVGRYWCAPPEVAVRLDTKEGLFKSKDEKYIQAEFLIRQTAAYPIVGPHEHTQYFRNSLHGLRAPDNGIDVRYLVALLNSKLIRFAYVETIREASQRTFPQVKLGALASLPLREIASGDTAGRALHDRLVELVDALLQLHRKLRTESNPARRDALANQAAALDGEIDQCVYRLYDLTEAEIGAVERVVQELVPPP